jgi:hypothetical protein
MSTNTEKTAFSGRLRLLMRGTSPTLRGATALARWFNQYYDHNKPVSPQTTHKWLSGRTVLIRHEPHV